ncbi:isocitrate lyase/phosphoenolpyruvate mutase family protein [Ruegeria sp. 2205SS24-7]|uniref:isocitrate lyase/PEP mutase family protein n=1 Tax=Ruegeria discodermiae TaxID=3064389 RepID=UPI0027409C14|nr:isocitrate lyase/phosphoenolpyruvate mutase family protein [Ruegeria sp. 2205SS24-7]MDP5219599.1 isocitrate lyase/phosphoenolpyruvate mutase family protein [Ruegeria sp. 2205SS24-7]
MTQADKARAFAALHQPGTPLILYNAWDAGSAKAVAKAGADAIATGSWSLAEAQGYRDGEDIPLAFALQIAGRIATSVDLPVSFDFEAGYADDPEILSQNAGQVIESGVVGVNFEDRIIGGDALRSVEAQVARIATLRRVADHADLPFFINARSDVFFQDSTSGDHSALMEEALTRARAYAAAGASGLFLPGLVTPELIGEICTASPLPVNIMQTGQAPDHATLAKLGVARISHGPAPYLKAMAHVTEAAKKALDL